MEEIEQPKGKNEFERERLRKERKLEKKLEREVGFLAGHTLKGHARTIITNTWRKQRPEPSSFHFACVWAWVCL